MCSPRALRVSKKCLEFSFRSNDCITKGIIKPQLCSGFYNLLTCCFGLTASSFTILDSILITLIDFFLNHSTYSSCC